MSFATISDLNFTGPNGSTWDLAFEVWNASSASNTFRVVSGTRTVGSERQNPINPILAAKLDLQVYDESRTLHDKILNNDAPDIRVTIKQDGTIWHQGLLNKVENGDQVRRDNPRLDLSITDGLQFLRKTRFDEYGRPDLLELLWYLLTDQTRLDIPTRVAIAWNDANANLNNRGRSEALQHDLRRQIDTGTLWDVLLQTLRFYNLQAWQEDGKWYVLHRSYRDSNQGYSWEEKATDGTVTTGTIDPTNSFADTDWFEKQEGRDQYSKVRRPTVKGQGWRGSYDFSALPWVENAGFTKGATEPVRGLRVPKGWHFKNNQPVFDENNNQVEIDAELNGIDGNSTETYVEQILDERYVVTEGEGADSFDFILNGEAVMGTGGSPGTQDFKDVVVGQVTAENASGAQWYLNQQGGWQQSTAYVRQSLKTGNSGTPNPTRSWSLRFNDLKAPLAPGGSLNEVKRWFVRVRLLAEKDPDNDGFTECKTMRWDQAEITNYSQHSAREVETSRTFDLSLGDDTQSESFNIGTDIQNTPSGGVRFWNGSDWRFLHSSSSGLEHATRTIGPIQAELARLRDRYAMTAKQTFRLIGHVKRGNLNLRDTVTYESEDWTPSMTQERILESAKKTVLTQLNNFSLSGVSVNEDTGSSTENDISVVSGLGGTSISKGSAAVQTGGAAGGTTQAVSGSVDVITLDASSGNVTKSLPAAGSSQTAIVVRTDTSSNTAIIQDPNGNNIIWPGNTNTSNIDLEKEESLFFTSDGSQWYVEEGKGLFAVGDVELDTSGPTTRAIRFIGATEDIAWQRNAGSDYALNVRDVTGAADLFTVSDAGALPNTTLDDIDNVSAPSPSNHDLLQYDGTNFVSEPTHKALTDAGVVYNSAGLDGNPKNDTSLLTKTEGDNLYDKVKDHALGSSAHTDSTIGSPGLQAGHLVFTNGSRAWASDQQPSPPSDGDVPVWDGIAGHYKFEAGAVSVLADLNDVSGATQTDGYVLASDGTNYLGENITSVAGDHLQLQDLNQQLHDNLTSVDPDDHHAQDHATRHAQGGADEIDAADLSGASGTSGQVLETDGTVASWSTPSLPDHTLGASEHTDSSIGLPTSEDGHLVFTQGSSWASNQTPSPPSDGDVPQWDGVNNRYKFVSGGVSVLADLSDVSGASQNNGDVLASSGGDYQGEAITSLMSNHVAISDLNSHQHGDLNGVGTDDHHAQNHSTRHVQGGADEVNVDNLAAGSGASAGNFLKYDGSVVTWDDVAVAQHTLGGSEHSDSAIGTPTNQDGHLVYTISSTWGSNQAPAPPSSNEVPQWDGSKYVFTSKVPNADTLDGVEGSNYAQTNLADEEFNGSITSNKGGTNTRWTSGEALGTFAMEWQTLDGGGSQATRFAIKGGSDKPDIQLLNGASGSESAEVVFQNGGELIGLSGITSPSYALHVGGDVAASGAVRDLSDVRRKEGLSPITGALEVTEALTGYTYERTDRDVGRTAGLVAQEVEQVFPEAVSEGDWKNLDLGAMLGLAFQAINELKDQLNEHRS